MGMEIQTYPQQLARKPKRRQGGGGALWGLVLGMLGGVTAAVVLAAQLAVSDAMESGSFEDAGWIFLLFGFFGGIVGLVVGGVLGVVVGALLGYNRLEHFAPWVTAAICAAVPLLAAVEFAGGSPADERNVRLSLVAAGLFALIGYGTGTIFENRLVEDAGWLTEY